MNFGLQGNPKIEDDPKRNSASLETIAHKSASVTLPLSKIWLEQVCKTTNLISIIKNPN